VRVDHIFHARHDVAHIVEWILVEHHHTFIPFKLTFWNKIQVHLAISTQNLTPQNSSDAIARCVTKTVPSLMLKVSSHKNNECQ
jgi:hypothetical protein